MLSVNVLGDETHITLSPNRSATWADSKLFILFVGGMSLIVATGWFFAGAWLILPFAGLEVALFGYLTYQVCYRTYYQQKLVLHHDHISLIQGYRHPSSITLPRSTVYITMSECKEDWHLPKVLLTSTHRKWPIGDFLNKEERLALFDILKSSGIPASRSQWWKQ